MKRAAAGVAAIGLAIAACKNEENVNSFVVDTSDAPARSAKPPASAASASPSAKGSAAPVGSASADRDACGPTEVWKPTPAKSDFKWAESVPLDKAPKDGVYAHLAGGTEPIKLDKIELWIDKKRKEWTLKAESGPVGPSLIFVGEPKVGEAVTAAFGTGHRGFFQMPKGAGFPQCFRQTTSVTGEHGRVVKLTKLDEKAKLADGAFVTTWRDASTPKREMWAAGTFKNARVEIFD